MKIIVNPHKCEIVKTPVNEKEINVSKCEFEFSEEIPNGYVKEAYFTYNGTTYKQILFNNECDFPPEVLVKKGQIEIGVVVYETTDEQYVQRFNPSPAYFETWQGSLKDEFENSEEITPTDKEQLINALNDGLDRIDSAVEDVNVAVEEANNLDLDVSKSGKIATVTLTKKDTTTKTVTLSDGTSLMFNWDGTRLGIKTDEDTEYTYVDLQGVQGPIGPKGEAFTIKKTYSSVAEMNADFNNMQLGDYVMIASTVEIEDNAKLYTRGESQWIFISDFSGAQGIKGETGLTPNIQIGTVVSGDNPSVTRTGTNENPILNFTLVKGDKGDTGNTGPTGATGNGIASIQKTSTSGLVDTYTITYTNGNTTTFNVTNGEDGEVTETELDVVRTDVDDLRRNQLMDTETGTSINVDNAFDTRIMKSVMTKESTQTGTPTPENPVEVKTVKGYRNVFDKENVNWYRNNNGIFDDKTNNSTTRIRTSSFQIQGNKTYTISGIPSGITLLQVRQYSNEEIKLDNASLSNNVFILSENCYYIHLMFGGSNFTNETNELMKNADIQLVEGTEELPYVPYGTNWIYTKVTNGTDTNYYTIPLNDNEIAGIGDYKDELMVDNSGHCWLNKKTSKVVLNGSENWQDRPNYSYADRFVLQSTIIPRLTVKSFSNYFLVDNGSYDDLYYLYLNNGQQILINFSQKGTTTLSQFKEWLTTHNTDIYYPTLQENLIDLNYNVDIRLFNGVNNITNSDDMDMEITYVQDINAIINELRNGQAL